MPEMVVPWSLLQRAGSLFDAIGWLLKGPSEAATLIVARSLTDLAITVAWLCIDPATRVSLWTAEAYRRELELRPVLEEHIRVRPRETDESKSVMATKRSFVSEARRLARDSGMAGVGRKGPLIPNLQKRAEAVGTDATRVAYALFFGPWSEWGHTGAGSLAVRVEGGTAFFEDGPPRDPVQVLSVTGALYA